MRARIFSSSPGQLGAQRIVDAVEPDEEQVARHAAGVPIALLLEAADLADAGARRHRHHRRMRRMVLRRQRELPFGRGGAAQRADLAVRPVLLRDPAQRVVAVGLRLAEDLVFAFREIAAALVLDDEDIAALDRLERVAQVDPRSLCSLYGVFHRIVGNGPLRRPSGV
jgi:hypothetical protein